MKKLDSVNYKQAFHVYKQARPFFAIIGAVLEGKQGGLVFTDSNSHPASFFVVHKFGFSQCFYISKNDSFVRQVISLLSANKENLRWGLPDKIRLYAPNQQFQDDLGGGRISQIQKSERVQMRLSDEARKKHQDLEEVDVNNARNDFERLNIELNLGLNQRFWDSKEDFLEGGQGYFVQLKATKEIVSLCYAAAMSNMIAEIDILTAEKFRGKGFASIAANIFINNCLGSGIIPNWDCYTNNLPSLNLAIKLGFKEAMVYDFYTVSFK